MKKLTALLLSALMILSMTTNVFAEGTKDGAVIEGSAGESVETVSFENDITRQPESASVKAGEAATFTAGVRGSVLSYQWQVSKDGGKKWSNLSTRTYGSSDTLKITAKESYNGYLYRCEVTFADNKVKTSEAAELKVRKNVPYPAVTMSSEEVNGVTVEIEAPEGALPEGATMEVSSVSLNAVQNAVDKAAELSGTVVAAVDITFFDAEGAVIEPEGEIKVTMRSAEIAKAENPVVVHLDTTAEELEGAEVEPEKVDAEAEAEAVVFNADRFSVYAVLEPGEGGDEARATVEFYGLDDAKVATFYVKNSDVMPPADDSERDPNASYIDHIVTDPGVGGQVPTGQIFLGWYIGDTKYTSATVTPMTIDGVRQYLVDLSITEGMTVKVWAVILKVFTVTYLDEQDISMGTDELKLLTSETSISYTVSKTYVPTDPTKNFEGWDPTDTGKITNAQYNGTAVAAPPYKMGTTMTISGSITFTVNAPKGNWLVFDENGKGATYNAPQFVKSGEPTIEPTLEMKRLGYEFGGWYTDQACTDGNEFVFGPTITERTVIYAKWTEVTTAHYSVIFWEQNVDGDGYDFAGSDTKTENVGTAVTVSSSGNTITARAGNNTSTHTVKAGFSYSSADTGKTILPDGSTIVNVYIDRNSYTLTFRDYTYTATTSNNGTQYGDVNGERVRVYRINNQWRLTNTNNGTVYNGTRYTRSNNVNSTVKTITALYGQDISGEFPIIGTNGFTYRTGIRWNPDSNLNVGGQQYFTHDTVIAYIDRMTPGSMTFQISDPEDRTEKTMNYWVETVNNTPSSSTVETMTYKGVLYELYTRVVAKYNGVTIEDYMDLDGFTHFEADRTIPTSGNPNGYYYNGNNVATLVNFYYTREKYAFNFNDGSYFDGNNNRLAEEYAPTGHLNTINDIIYGSDTTSYNKGGADFYGPESAYPGFVIEGWYLDDTCSAPYTFTTMPKGGVTLYAKWRQIQYRVFLHPNATLPDGTNDSSLDWGDEGRVDDQGNPVKQAMNFRISYMGQLSMPTGLRDEYEFIGWFMDAAMTVPFDPDSKLTDQLVTADYDKNDPANYTDEMNKFGQIEGEGWNSDLIGWDHDNDKTTPGIDRYWVTKKLDLYGKWSELLTGALGVGVIYDANGGSNAPLDTKKYKDNINALAGTAATPKTGERFLYWVVQKWNAETEAYEDTEVTVYPGAPFTIHKYLAKETDLSSGEIEYKTDEDGNQILDEEGNPIPLVYKAYTMQLRAEYGPAEAVKDTFIHWYQNEEGDAYKEPIYTSTDAKGEGLQINEATPIFDLVTAKDSDGEDLVTIKRGHVFLGWARMPEFVMEDGVPKLDAEGNKIPIPYYALTEKDLYLKYDAVNEQYLYNTGTAEEPTWEKVVTQVAADEKMPYHALYAVWKDVIYIVHGAKGTVEIVDLADTTKERNEFTTGYDAETGKYTTYYYGGYGLIADTTAADPSGFTLTKGGAEATWSGTYTWSRANAQKNANAFTISTDEAVASASKRTVGDVFYIKEVPSSYLAAPKIATVKADYGAGALTSVSILSVVDTTIYRAGGINGTKGTFASSFTMTQNNGGTSSTTAKQLFGLEGYLTVNAWATTEVSNLTLVPFWTTYDSITVNSNSSRTITISGNEVTNAKAAGLE